MRRLICFLVVMFLGVFNSNSDLSAQEFDFSVGGTIIFDAFRVGANGKAFYSLNENFVINPGLTFFFGDVYNYIIDLDMYYANFIAFDDSVFISPKAGLYIANRDALSDGVGLNLGVIIDFEDHNSSRFYIEPKFLIGKLNKFAIAGGFKF